MPAIFGSTQTPPPDGGVPTRLLFVGSTSGSRLSWFKETSDMVFTKMPDIATAVPGTVRAVSVHPSGTMVVAAHDTAPYVSVYAIDQTAQTLTKLSNLPNLPTDSARAVHFSPDGDYLMVGFNASPYCRFYSVSGTTFTSLPVPTLVGPPSFAQWNRTSDAVCFVYQATTVVSVYTRSGSTLTAQSVSSIDTTGLVNFNGCAWSTNKLIVTGSGTQATSIQGWNWPNLTKMTSNTIAKHLSGTTGNMRQCHFTGGGSTLFCGLGDEPRVSARLVNKSGVINPLALDTNIPNGQVVAGVNDGVIDVTPNSTCSGLRVSHDGKYLATASAGASIGLGMLIFKLDGYMGGKLKHESIDAAVCVDWWPRAEDY